MNGWIQFSDKMPPKNLIPLEYVAKIFFFFKKKHVAKILRKNTKKEQLYLTVPV